MASILPSDWLDRERDAAARAHRDEATRRLSRAQTTMRTYQAQSRPMDRDRPARRFLRWLSRTDCTLRQIAAATVLVCIASVLIGQVIEGAMTAHNANRLERSE